MEARLPEAWKTLYCPATVVAGVALATATANFFLPVYLKSELRFTGSQIGWLYALYSMTTLLAVIPAGLRNDRSSPRRLIAWSLVLISAAALGMTFARGSLFYGATFLLYGLGLSTFRISTDALMFKTGNGRSPGMRFGWFNALKMGGVGAGTFAAGYVLWKWGFAGGLLLVAAIACLTLSATPMLSPVKVGFPGLREYVSDLKEPAVASFLAWLFLFSLHWGAELTCYGLFLRENLGLSLTGMGWYMGTEYMALAATCLWAGFHYDRGLDLRLLAAAGLLASGVGQISMCEASQWPSLAWRCVHGIGDGLIMTVLYIGVANLFQQSRVGGNSSAVNLVMMMGSFVGSLIFGPMGEQFGYDKPLLITGVVVAMLSLPTMAPLASRSWSRAGHHLR
ncbi:MAG: MFS transporter [bacterium]